MKKYIIILIALLSVFSCAIPDIDSEAKEEFKYAVTPDQYYAIGDEINYTVDGQDDEYIYITTDAILFQDESRSTRICHWITKTVVRCSLVYNSYQGTTEYYCQEYTGQYKVCAYCENCPPG